MASSAGLAESLIQQERFAEAEVVYRSLIQTQPKEPAWHVNLAAALTKQDRTDEARASLEQAVVVDPGFVTSYLRLATLHTRAGERDEAIATIERGLAGRPDDVNLLAQLAWFLATSSVEALRDGSRAIELATRAHTYSSGTCILANEALAAAQAETGFYAIAEQLIADLLSAPPGPLLGKDDGPVGIESNHERYEPAHCQPQRRGDSDKRNINRPFQAHVDSTGFERLGELPALHQMHHGEPTGMFFVDARESSHRPAGQVKRGDVLGHAVRQHCSEIYRHDRSGRERASGRLGSWIE